MGRCKTHIVVALAILGLGGCSEFSNVRQLQMKSGALYTGQLKSDSFARPDGEGTMVYPNGAQYTGSWSRGVYDGVGRYQTPDGTDYHGTFQNDRPWQVSGKMLLGGIWYEGVWDRATGRGKGTITWPDKRWYTGDWIILADNKAIPEGDGELHYADGSVFSGRFYNSQPDGYGTLTSPDGRKTSGLFINGTFTRKLAE